MPFPVCLSVSTITSHLLPSSFSSSSRFRRRMGRRRRRRRRRKVYSKLTQ